eukprot:97889-Chlamydomonas_euryale.AAC.1
MAAQRRPRSDDDVMMAKFPGQTNSNHIIPPTPSITSIQSQRSAGKANPTHAAQPTLHLSRRSFCLQFCSTLMGGPTPPLPPLSPPLTSSISQPAVL